jgi:protein DGCR14
MQKDIVKLTQLRYFSKPPPPQPIEEDDYVEGISEIIKRDFFPELDKLRTETELLDAEKSSDSLRIKHLEKEMEKWNQEPSKGVGLDQYQQKFTSEDNASFSQILEKDNQLRKEQYHFFYDKEKKQLLLEEGKNPLQLEPSVKPMLTWEYRAKNALMYGPREVALTTADLPTTRGEPKELVHRNTRFKEPLKVFKEAEENEETKQIFDAIGGRESTPQVAGYKMVPATPDLRPNEDVDPSELMTWGTIASTPLLLDSGKHEGPSYHIPDTPQRELLANKLSEKASASLRKRQGPTPRFKTPVRNSPAVQHLHRQLNRSTMDFGLRASYGNTPQPRSIRGTPTVTPRRATPLSSSRKRPDITDNLLNI